MTVRRSVVAGIIGAVGCLIGAIVDPHRAALAYLAGYAAVLTTVLGALFMIMIAQTTAATWFVVLRRQAEQVVGALPALALLFIPVLVAMPALYPWLHPDSLDPRAAALVRAKSAYLNVPFFLVRVVIYWAAWLWLAAALRRASLAQDAGGGDDAARRIRRLSAAGLPILGLTLSFASFDWLMSLSPTWYSTVYGVYVFAGGMVAAVALLAVIAWRACARAGGELHDAVSDNHLHALGKLLLTFVLFWVYIGFSQWIVIWSGDVPLEVTWYVARARAAWGVVALVLLAGHFALPFLLLLVRIVKRSPTAMGVLGAWMLAMHALDLWWVVLPEQGPMDALATLGWVLVDLAALLAVGGFALTAWQMHRHREPAVPQGDPRLQASVHYTTT